MCSSKHLEQIEYELFYRLLVQPATQQLLSIVFFNWKQIWKHLLSCHLCGKLQCDIHNPLKHGVSLRAFCSIKTTPLGFGHISHIVTCNPWKKTKTEGNQLIWTHLGIMIAWVWNYQEDLCHQIISTMVHHTWHKASPHEKSKWHTTAGNKMQLH